MHKDGRAYWARSTYNKALSAPATLDVCTARDATVQITTVSTYDALFTERGCGDVISCIIYIV